MAQISVIVPTLNEAGNVPERISRILDMRKSVPLDMKALLSMMAQPPEPRNASLHGNLSTQFAFFPVEVRGQEYTQGVLFPYNSGTEK